MLIDLNACSPGAPASDQSLTTAYRTCRVTDAPQVVAAIRAWEQKAAAFEQAQQRLGQVFGGTAAAITWLQGRFISGVQPVGGVELDRHWRRPDRWGFRTLRLRARIPSNMQLIAPAVIHAEHERLLGLWERYCPARIDASDTWQALGIHLGSVSLWGGSFFTRGQLAYLRLGFELEAGHPGLDWLDQAVTISRGEFDAALALGGEAA